MCINETLKKITKKRLLVVGDLILDHYTFGKVERISPEAPVPILKVEKESYLPGGAGNVMVNLMALGMEVVALSRVGNDLAGKQTLQTLEEKGVNIEHVVEDGSFVTPLKKRMIASNQQLVRVDYEKVTPLPQKLEEQVIGYVRENIGNFSAVAISDYAKGFCSSCLLSEIVIEARKASVAVVVDPKSNTFSKYGAATLLKPNLSEACNAAHLPLDAPLERVAEKILAEALCDHLLITRSSEGISLFSRGEERLDFPVVERKVSDVTGAGDTVCAILSASLANGCSLPDASMLANLAASVVVQKTGCASVSLSELRSATI